MGPVSLDSKLSSYGDWLTSSPTVGISLLLLFFKESVYDSYESRFHLGVFIYVYQCLLTTTHMHPTVLSILTSPPSTSCLFECMIVSQQVSFVLLTGACVSYQWLYHWREFPSLSNHQLPIDPQGRVQPPELLPPSWQDFDRLLWEQAFSPKRLLPVT